MPKHTTTSASPGQVREKALQIRSDFATARNNLGLALVQKGAVDEAIAQYQSALQSAPGYAEAHMNLGTALGKKGRVAEAIAHFREALELAQAAGQQDLAARLNDELKRCEAGSPLHQ